MKESSFISFVDVNKIYPNGVHAVVDFNLEIKRHEFIVLVGPSGCGKSTTLRMLAGLEDISRGTLFINGEIANNLTPKDRDLAMVFQSYALYPHMSVYNNLAFGLKMRKYQEPLYTEDGTPLTAIASHKLKNLQNIIKFLRKKEHQFTKKVRKLVAKEEVPSEKTINYQKLISEYQKIIETYEHQYTYYENTPIPQYLPRKYTKEEIDEKVNAAAQVLDITKYLHAKPRELSGGQRQRVALGRSIVRNANLFLMDEPLSNLDAKLRILMRSEIVALHRRLQSTTIYVTHDQTEAMTMADRIVIMKDGYMQQVGTPQEIYERPANLFTATFIGSPEMNIFKVKVCKEGLKFTANDLISHDRVDELHRAYLTKKIAQNDEYKLQLSLVERPLYFGIRPEDITITKTKKSNTLQAIVENIELLGKEYYVHLKVAEKIIVAIVSNRNSLAVNDLVYLSFAADKLYFFDPVSEENIQCG